MTDIKEKSNNPTAQTSATAATDKKEFVSWGKRIHNEITYRGVDWLLNSAVGVSTTLVTERTEVGKKYFGEFFNKLYKKILTPIMKSKSSAEVGASWATRFTSIMAGGFTIIPLMMFMENRSVKKATVRKLDEMAYGKEEVENDPKFQKSYDAIDQEPKKGFWTGMVARIIAITPLIAAASWEKSNVPLIKWVYDLIGNKTKWIAEKTGEKFNWKPSGWWKKGEMEYIDGISSKPKQFQNNWDFLHRTIGFDFGLTIVYSKLHEIAYKSLARFQAKNEALEDAADVARVLEVLDARDSDTNSPKTPANFAHIQPRERHIPAPKEGYGEEIAAERAQNAQQELSVTP